MTPHQLRTTLKHLDLTQVAAAKLLRVDGRTVRKWVSGDRSAPASAAILLKLIVAGKITIADVEAA
jgi:DNA-binding transcriptional regulator YiaG